MSDTPQEIDKILKTISVTTAHLAPGHCEIVKMDTAEAKQALQKLIASKEAVAVLNHLKQIGDDAFADDLGTHDYDRIAETVLQDIYELELKANLVKEEDSSNAPN